MNRTPAQQQAVDSTARDILVVAGPGSGKTATTVARIKNLIDAGTNPASIVAITFTNNAAREMEHRLIAAMTINGPDKWCFPSGANLGYIGTLHGFALRMLKRHGDSIGYGSRMTIVSPESAQELLESKASQLGCKTKLDDLLRRKAQGRPVYGMRWSIEETVIASYYQDLQDAGIVDFDILLNEFAKLLETDAGRIMTEGFTHLFVDEVQDSGSVDWIIYDRLPIANRFMVGDPDQAIYSFRGGNVGMMLKAADHSELIKLETNFRSHEEVCTAAQKLIEHNTGRIDKETISHKGPGAVVTTKPCLNEGEEIATIVRTIKDRAPLPEQLPESIAVLCRTNAIAYEIGQALQAAGLPVSLKAKSDLPKDWSHTRSLIELLVNPDNNTLAYFYLLSTHLTEGMNPASARKIANLTRREAEIAGQSINQYALHINRPQDAVTALGAASIHSCTKESRMLLAEIVQEIGAEATPLELALACANRHESKSEPINPGGIRVLTIHGAKGLEFDAVFLPGWEDEIIPGGRNHDVQEERQLAFVAITRARNFVLITHSATRKTSWGAIAQHTPSRFIAEMGGSQ